MQTPDSGENGEGAVAIVGREWQDAINAQKCEWCSQHECEAPGKLDSHAQRPEHDAPGEDGAEATHDGGNRERDERKRDPIKRMMAAWMINVSGAWTNGKLTVGHLTQGDPCRAVEGIARIPKHGDVGILPQHNRGCGDEETSSRGKVTQLPLIAGWARELRRWCF